MCIIKRKGLVQYRVKTREGYIAGEKNQVVRRKEIADAFKIGQQAFAHLMAFDGIVTNYIPRLEEHYKAIRALGVNLVFAED